MSHIISAAAAHWGCCAGLVHGRRALIQTAPLREVGINGARTPQQSCCSSHQRYNAVQCAAEVVGDDFEIVCAVLEWTKSIAAAFKARMSFFLGLFSKKVEAEKPKDLKDSGALKLAKPKDLKDSSPLNLEKPKDLQDSGAMKRKRSVVEGSNEVVPIANNVKPSATAPNPTAKDSKKPAVSAGTKPVADDKKAVAKPISEEKASKRQCS
jgi:hypothetical protein